MEDSVGQQIEPPRDARWRSSLEDLLPAREHVVQCVLEVRRRLGEFLSDLLYVLLVALLDFLAKELLQCPGTHSFVALLRVVRDHVRDESARQPLRLLIRIICQERIYRNLRWRRG